MQTEKKDILHNNRELGIFFSHMQKKSIAFLRKNYSLSLEAAEDVYQDSCLAMYENIHTGKLVSLTSKASTYFTKVCMFQALKKIRDTKPADSMTEAPYNGNRIDALIGLDGGFTIGQQQAMEKIIKSLPTPCNQILWAYYYDEMSMEEIAKIINFSNANSVKTKKSQCMSRLKDNYSDVIKELMYE